MKMKTTFSHGLVSFTAIVASVAAAPVSASAGVGARVSPPVSLAQEIQLYSLTVPGAKTSATETVVLTAPPGFTISSFVPSPGWQRVFKIGTAGDSLTEQVTWSGGRTFTQDDSLFQFLAEPTRTGTLAFHVEQTFSDGKTVNWSGPENSTAPAPTIEVRSSLGSVGRTPLLSWIALIAAAAGLIVAAAALLARGGRSLG